MARPPIDPELARPASRPEHDVVVLHDVRIPVRDGLELSANLWLPAPRADAPEATFPAILEMIPYRKDDWRFAGDQARGEWLAARGYALCRLDVRGTGSSPGIALDEYTEQETLDGYDAVAWLAAQPWCNGRVGMWGISYGGFTSIQVARLRPPALRAIVPVMATDDRYTDDVHYLGGCVTVSELSQYAVSMVGMNALPPKAEYRGAAWADEWRERLERTPIWLFEWLRRQHDGPYWRRGSLAPDYDAIEAAILMIGGWMDSYVDPVLRMQESCTAPRRSLIGNWVHDLPDTAYPGPNLDWLHEMVRFFDHWLKGVDNGVMDEPGLVFFRRQYAEPEAFPAAWPGAWVAASGYPVAGAGERILDLAPGSLPLVGRLVDGAGEGDGAAAVERFRHRPTVGTRAALSWGAGAAPNGLARDLRPDESLGPTFTGSPLTEALDILGVPIAELAWESGAAVATAVVRLSDVAPDGTSSQVTAGILNLTHRDSHASPAPLEPGVVTPVRVPMRATAYRFLPGHRIRLSVASSAWPVIWPSPEPAEHGLHLGGEPRSRLVLPTIPVDGQAAPPPFKTTPAGLREVGAGSDEPPVWRITEDVIDGSVTVSTSESGESVLPGGRVALYTGERLEMTARDDDPARARLHNEVVYRLRDHGSEILVEASGTLRSTATDFHMNVGLRVTLDGAPFFERGWLETIPRRLV